MRGASLLPVLLLAACGSRSGLLVPTGDAGVTEPGPDAAATCTTFPPIPEPKPASCTFAPTASPQPVLAAIAGQDLIALTSQGGVEKLFHFGYSTGSILERLVTSRGQYLGAMLIGFPATQKLEVEFVLMRLDGTVLVHHQETFAVKDFGGLFGIDGNAAGTFAFGASMGDFGGIWVTLANGSTLGPFKDVAVPYGGLYSPRVDPDERGRFLVLPVKTNSTADVYWLDPCSGAKTKSKLANAELGVGFGRELFGITNAGQLAVETADGMKNLAYPSLGTQFAVWDFTAPWAMFEVPPFPYDTSTEANLLLVNASTLADRHASLAYSGLSVVPPGAWLSSVGDSNNPAGFGLDSSGQVTMFLSDPTSVIHLYVTSNGGNWTPIGSPVTYDPMYGPSYSIKFAEAGGTYVIQGLASGGGMGWHVVRPSTSLIAPLAGAGQISHDGGCVAALVSSTGLDVLNAANGQLTQIALPFSVDSSAWVSTWIPGDDAVLPSY